MVTTLDYDDYVGKIAIGRIVRGKMHPNQAVIVTDGESQRKAKIGRVYTYEGLKRDRDPGSQSRGIIALIGCRMLKSALPLLIRKIRNSSLASKLTNRPCP